MAGCVTWRDSARRSLEAIQQASLAALALSERMSAFVRTVNRLEDERRAYAAFCADGGDPHQIRVIEEWLVPTTT